MKKLEDMTRKELATLIVEDQIKRGIVKEENKKSQIQARLTGVIRMSWTELYNSAKSFI